MHLISSVYWGCKVRQDFSAPLIAIYSLSIGRIMIKRIMYACIETLDTEVKMLFQGLVASTNYLYYKTPLHSRAVEVLFKKTPI